MTTQTRARTRTAVINVRFRPAIPAGYGPNNLTARRGRGHDMQVRERAQVRATVNEARRASAAVATSARRR